MAEARNNNNPTTSHTTTESFNTFFQNWISEQNNYLQQLVTASNNHKQNQNDQRLLAQLIQKVVQHYEQYYQEKSVWEKQDAISMLTPTWRSSLEDAFLWIGGWRPTLAIHLLYSKSGLQLEAKLGDLIRGISTGDLGDLAPNQMERIDCLHKKTIQEERVLTEKLAKLQESVADRSMVELSNAVSEMMRSGESDQSEEKVRRALELKNEEVEELLHMADELRLETLKALVEVLTPIQAVYFLIAAAELHLRLHEWGKKRLHGNSHEEMERNNVESSHFTRRGLEWCSRLNYPNVLLNTNHQLLLRIREPKTQPDGLAAVVPNPLVLR